MSFNLFLDYKHFFESVVFAVLGNCGFSALGKFHCTDFYPKLEVGKPEYTFTKFGTEKLIFFCHDSSYRLKRVTRQPEKDCVFQLFTLGMKK